MMSRKPDLHTEDVGKLKREINPPEEILHLRDRIAELEQRLVEYKKQTGSLRSLFRDLRTHIHSLPPKPIEYEPPKTKEGLSDRPIVAVLQISDSHMGMIQESDEVEGFNAFNPDLCVRRSMYFVRQAVRWIDVHRRGYRCDEIVFLVTADLISGDIHRDLTVTNAFPVPVQVVKAGYLLADQISYVSPYFEKVRVEFIVADNHSRLTPKPQTHEAGLNSLNYIVGYLAKILVSDQSNVTFNVWPMLQKVVKVQNRSYLITHGHQVRSWAGFPWYGLDRKVGREATKRMLTGKHPFDRIVLGHYHTGLAHPWYWIGGSVSGTDANDHKEARFSEPTQAGWLVHPKFGEFDRTDFKLAEADELPTEDVKG